MNRRQKILLGVLGAAVLLALWMNFGSGGSDAPARPARAAAAGGGDGEIGGAVESPRPAARAVSADSKDRDVREIVPLHIADLSRTPRSFLTGRDPWRFVEPPPPPPPAPHKLTAAELRALQEAEAARQRLLAQQAAAAAADAAIPKPPPFTWTYLGNFGPAAGRIAVFVDGQKVYNARQGEVIGGRFLVAQIGFESVDIAFVGFPDWPHQRLGVAKK